MVECLNPEPQAGVTLRLAQSWGDAVSVTGTAVKQQACLSAALVEAVRRLGRLPIEQHPGLLPALLAGVSVRLESPLPAIRCGFVGREPRAPPIPCLQALTPQVCAIDRSIRRLVCFCDPCPVPLRVPLYPYGGSLYPYGGSRVQAIPVCWA